MTVQPLAPGRPPARAVAPLRVLHVIDQLNPGGAENFTVELIARLDPDRHERTLCVTRQVENWYAGDARERTIAGLRERGVRLLELDRTGTFDVGAWRRLVGVLRDERVQVVHAHMFGSSVWGTLLGRLARVPVVVAHEHGSPEHVGRVRSTLEGTLLARGVDRYLAVSEADRRRLVARGVPEERTTVFANGIATPEVDLSRDVRAELGIPADAPLAVSVGNLRPEKAFEVLLEAVADVRASGMPLRLLLIGDGYEREALEQLAARLGIADAVVWTGQRADVADLVRVADVAVNTSDREGSPLSVMEYMEAELPVVATAVGGVPDLIEDGVHGRLVPPRAPGAVADAIREVLGDPEAAAQMGRRGHARRRAEFDLDGAAERLADLYRELLARRTGA